jgi:putative FmdB family regulatory protein
MPIYEYRRPDGTTFEIQQSFSEDPLTTDPETGVPVERVLHPPAVHFKGKGFYSTDYGTRNRERETAAAGQASSPGASSDGSSAEGASSGSDSSSAPSSEGAAKNEKGASHSARSEDSKPLAAKS